MKCPEGEICFCAQGDCVTYEPECELDTDCEAACPPGHECHCRGGLCAASPFAVPCELGEDCLDACGGDPCACLDGFCGPA